MSEPQDGTRDIRAKVFQAADAFAAAGEKPTLESVRSAINGGSYRDIAPALREWREERANRPQADDDIPPEITRAFAGFSRQITKLFRDENARAMKAAWNEYKEKLGRLEQSMLEACDRADVAEKAAAAAQSQCQVISNELSSVQSDLSTASEALEHSRRHARDAEERLAQLQRDVAEAAARVAEDHQRVIEELNRDFAKKAAELADTITSLRRELQASQELAAELKLSVSSQREVIDEQRAQLRMVRSERARAKKRIPVNTPP